MSSSILMTVAAVLAVGGGVALVDRWREARTFRRLRPIDLVRGGASTHGDARPRQRNRRVA